MMIMMIIFLWVLFVCVFVGVLTVFYVKLILYSVYSWVTMQLDELYSLSDACHVCAI